MGDAGIVCVIVFLVPKGVFSEAKLCKSSKPVHFLAHGYYIKIYSRSSLSKHFLPTLLGSCVYTLQKQHFCLK